MASVDSKDTPIIEASETTKISVTEVIVVSENESKSDIMPAAVKSGKEVMQTAPFDQRFPNTNQTRYCYQSYLDYHRCQKVKGQDFAPCGYFKQMYGSLCPNAWVEKWDDQIQNGCFAGKI